MAIIDQFGRPLRSTPRDRYRDDRIDRIVGSVSKQPTKDMAEIAMEARKRVSESAAATSKTREERRICRGFMEQHYTEDEIQSRGSDRPAIQIRAVESRVQQVMDDFRTAGIGSRLGSATGGDASFYNGLILRDQRDSLSEAAMEVIVRGSVMYGEWWGQWYPVDEDEMPADGNPTLFGDQARRGDPVMPSGDALSLGALDKRLRMRSCDPDYIYEDPNDDTPDRSQMDFLIEVQRMTVERRNRLYPDAKKLPASAFEADDAEDWWLGSWPRGGRGPERDAIVRVAHYYKKVTETMEFVWTPGFGHVAIRVDRMSAEQQAMVAEGVDVRRFQQDVSVLWLHVTDGVYELTTPRRLPWGVIPYFRAVGDEMKTNDGQMLKRGMVFELKDLNRVMDVSLSATVHKLAVAGQDGWIAPTQAIKHHPSSWRDTTIPRSVREYDAFISMPGPGGEYIQVPPPVYHSSEPAIAAGVAAVQSARELIGMTTGSADGQDRDEAAAYRSGVAIDRMDRMAATNRQKYIWNAENITAYRSGEIWRRMSPFIYDRPGRYLAIAGQQQTDSDEGVIIGIPFIRIKGKPVPLPPEVGDAESIPDPQNPEVVHEVHRFDPTKEVVKVTTHATNLSNAGRAGLADTLLALMQTNPNLTPALAEEAIAALGDRFPVEGVLSKIKAMFPEPVDPSKGVNVEQLPALVKQLQQQLQQKDQIIQGLAQAADQTRAAKQISDDDNETKRAIAEIREEWATMRKRMEIDQKREAKFVDAAMDADKATRAEDTKAVIKGAELAVAAARGVGSDQKKGNDNAG